MSPRHVPRDGRPDEPAGLHEERRATRTSWLGVGSLACPECDAPTPLWSRTATPATALACPFCDHAGLVRDFLTLTAPHRAPRVNVYVSSA